MKQRKNQIIAVALFVVVAVVVATYAYWNQTATVDNPFDTGKYGSTITENFAPSDGKNWQPGIEANKDVAVNNTGDQDLIVRARLDETWTRKGESAPYKDSKNDPYDVYVTSQADATDGLTAADGSVVTKNLSTSANWIDGGDGWYYYAANLQGGQMTDEWLTSVELLNDTDMGKMETKYYVSASDDANPDNWVWYPYTGSMPSYIDASGNPCGKDDPGAQKVLHNKTETVYAMSGGSPLIGYSDSDYVLRVTVQTVQATQEAIDAVFGGGSSFAAPAGTTWTVQ